MKTGQNCINNRDINQNHSTKKYPGISSGISGVEEVFGKKKKKSSRIENTESHSLFGL